MNLNMQKTEKREALLCRLKLFMDESQNSLSEIKCIERHSVSRWLTSTILGPCSMAEVY